MFLCILIDNNMIIVKETFDNVNHEWMLKFLEHDIADRKFLDIRVSVPVT